MFIFGKSSALSIISTLFDVVTVDKCLSSIPTEDRRLTTDCRRGTCNVLLRRLSLLQNNFNNRVHFFKSFNSILFQFTVENSNLRSVIKSNFSYPVDPTLEKPTAEPKLLLASSIIVESSLIILATLIFLSNTCLRRFSFDNFR